MILKFALSLVWSVVSWLLGLFNFPAAVSMTNVLSYIQQVFTAAAGMVFYFFRPATFYAACDIVFFIWTAEPLYHFAVWVMRKLPFLNMS